MRYFIGIVLGALWSVVIFTGWPALVNQYGAIGGWLGPFLMLPMAWATLHYWPVFPNHKDGAWVDLALIVGIAATFGGIKGGFSPFVGTRELLAVGGIYHGADVTAQLPTLAAIVLGAVFGAYVGVQADRLIAAAEAESEEKGEKAA